MADLNLDEFVDEEPVGADLNLDEFVEETPEPFADIPAISGPINAGLDFVQRKVDLIGSAYKNSRDHVNASAEIGAGIRERNPVRVAKGSDMMAKIKPPEIEPKTVGEKIISGTVGMVPMIFNENRLERIQSALEDPIRAGAYNPMLAPITGLLQFDADTMTGQTAHALMQVKDPGSGEGLSEDIVYGVSMSAGIVGAAITAFGGSAVGGVANSAKNKAVTVATQKLTDVFTKRQLPKLITDLAVSTAKGTGTMTAVMTALEASNIAHEEIAKALNNTFEGTDVPQAEVSYLTRRMGEAMENAVYAGFGVTASAKAIGAMVAVPRIAAKKIDASENNVLNLERKWEEANRRILPEEAVRPVEEMLSPDEEIAQQRVADIIAENSDDVVVEQLIEDELLTRQGKPAGVSRQEYKAAKGVHTALIKDLYGANATETVPARTGLLKQLRDARAENIALKEKKVRTKDPERRAVLDKIEVLKGQIRTKKQQLSEAADSVKMMYDPEVGRAEVAKIRNDIALDTVTKEGERGWLDESEMTREGHDAFKAAVREARAQTRKAASAGDAEGFARGKATIRQLVQKRRRVAVETKERGDIVREINGKIREGAKRSGVLTAKANSIFQAFKQIRKIKPEEAEGLLSSDAPITGVQDVLVRSLLKLRTGVRKMTKVELMELRDGVNEFFDTGNYERFEKLQAEAFEILNVKDGVLKEILGENYQDELAAYRQNEGRGPLDGRPLSVWGRVRKTLEAPGHGAIMAWRGYGKTLLRDVYTRYEDSFIGKLFETIDQEKVRRFGVVDDTREFYSMLADSFGLPKDGKTERQVRTWLSKEMMSEPTPVLDATGSPFKYVDAKGVEQTLKFTRGQRIQRASELLRAGMAEHFTEALGYTEEMINAILDLSPEDARFQKLMFSYYERMHDKVNEIFSDINGYNLPKDPNYVPILREGFDASSNLSPLLRDMQFTRATGTNAHLEARAKNSKKPVVLQDAFEAMQLYSRDMNHYVAMAKKMQELNGILRDHEIHDGIKAAFGKEVGADIIVATTDTLDVLGRGYTEFRSTMTLFDYVRTNVVKASLAAKVLIGVKQLNSIMLFAEERGLGAKEFAMGVAEFMRNPKAAREVMRSRSRALAERGLDIDKDLVQTLKGMEKWKIDQDGSKRFFVNEVSNSLLAPIHYGDKAAIYAGGYSLYRHLLRKGMAPEDAMRRVETVVRDTQQSTELSTQSKLQMDKGPIAKLATTYSTATFSMIRRNMDAMRDTVRAIDELNAQKERLASLKLKGATASDIAAQKAILDKAAKNKKTVVKQAAKTFIIYHVLAGVSYNVASNLGEVDLAEVLAAAIGGPLDAVPVVGESIEYALRHTFGLNTYEANTIVSTPLKDLALAVNDVIQGEVDSTTGRRLAGAAQMAVPLPFKQGYDLMSSLVNDLPEGELKKTLAIIFGASKGTVEKVLDE